MRVSGDSDTVTHNICMKETHNYVSCNLDDIPNSERNPPL
jgi:hypothetical protein